MQEKLPIGDFCWNKSEWSEEDILALDDNAETGYFFEVALKYPQQLHEKHNDYPFGPQNIRIDEQMLSTYQKELAKNLNIKIGSQKLCLTLKDKTIVCHYRQLKNMIQHGLKIVDVKKVLQFKQASWLRPYIEKNTQLRQKATSKFEESLAKLFNNSVFGKTLQDSRHHIDIKLATDLQQLQKKINSNLFNGCKIYGEGLAAVEMKKQKILLDRPR